MDHWEWWKQLGVLYPEHADVGPVMYAPAAGDVEAAAAELSAQMDNPARCRNHHHHARSLTALQDLRVRTNPPYAA